MAGDALPQPARYTVIEICRDLGLSRERVYELLATGVIPNVRIGRTWLITRAAYEQWKKTCGMKSNGVKV